MPGAIRMAAAARGVAAVTAAAAVETTKAGLGDRTNRPRGGGGGEAMADLRSGIEIIRRSQDASRTSCPVASTARAFLPSSSGHPCLCRHPVSTPSSRHERGVELRFGKPKDEISMRGFTSISGPLRRSRSSRSQSSSSNIGARATSTSAASGVSLTGDQNIVIVQFSVLYTVSDPNPTSST